MNSPDLRTEVVLDPSIRFQQPYSANQALAAYFSGLYRINNPRAVFLTGATGLLGVNLLHELLEKTSASVYCLVRGNSVFEGNKRLKSQLEYFRYWDDAYIKRIFPIMGDLQKPLFGMRAEDFDNLAATINVVFHNGAAVSHFPPYSALKAANVLGTQEALRLAGHIRTKPVHYVSSLGVFLSAPYFTDEVIKETDIPQWNKTLKGGYTQSKWVAEQLVMLAQKRGLPACIYRPIRIMGHSLNGITNNYSDLLLSLLKTCISLKKYPTADTVITFVPVDYLSRAVVHLSLKQSSLGKAFNFFNPQPISYRAFFQLIKKLGYALEEVDFDRWVGEIKRRTHIEPENNLFHMMEAMSHPEVLFNGAKYLKFDATQTLAGLSDSPIACPPVNEELIAAYLAHLQAAGFIPAASPRA